MSVRVRCAGDLAAELAVRDELLGWLASVDLSPWIFTSDVVIQEGAVPHSHPELTLNTFNRGPFLLASFLHEQLHWYLTDLDPIADVVYEQVLEGRYPQVPVGLPEGAQSRMSTYLHLMVCWFEVEALRRVVGEERGTALARRLSEVGVYRWVYRTVLADFDELGSSYAAYGLHRPSGRDSVAGG